MKTIKTIAKAAVIAYVILSLIATVAVNLGCYDVLEHKGALTVIEIQPATMRSGLTVLQHSPFCNACDVFLWGFEFQHDGNVRFFSDGLYMFGQY